MTLVHSTGEISPPKYPVWPVINDEEPDRDLAEQIRRGLEILNKDLPTPFADMPRYRLTWAGSETRFWFGYTTLRYREKLVRKQVGWLVPELNGKDQPKVDPKTGKTMFHQLDINHDKWPQWAKKFKSRMMIPDWYYFDIGRQCYVIEEYIDPAEASLGWDRLSKAYELTTGRVVDILGPEPTRGAYVPVLWICDEETGAYIPPNPWHLDVVTRAHHKRNTEGKAQDRPGGAYSESTMHDAMLRYYAAAEERLEEDMKILDYNVEEAVMKTLTNAGHFGNIAPQIQVPTMPSASEQPVSEDTDNG